MEWLFVSKVIKTQLRKDWFLLRFTLVPLLSYQYKVWAKMMWMNSFSFFNLALSLRTHLEQNQGSRFQDLSTQRSDINQRTGFNVLQGTRGQRFLSLAYWLHVQVFHILLIVCEFCVWSYILGIWLYLWYTSGKILIAS